MKRNIFKGLVMILIAVLIMASAMGFLPDIPWFKLFGGLIFVSAAAKALYKRNFFGAFMSAGIVAWIFENELGIEELVPFPLLIAAGFLGIGFGMIFGKKKTFEFEYSSDDGETRFHSIDEARAQNKFEDGREVVFTNAFGQTSKYVNSASFSSAYLENAFGSANIYFNNAVIDNGRASMKVENSFGQMNIYFPKTWRVNIKQDTAFGPIKVFGEPNRDMDAPYLDVDVDNAFGQTNFYFE